MKDFNFFFPYIEDNKIIKDDTFKNLVIGGIVTVLMLGLFTWNNIKIKNMNEEIEEIKVCINDEMSLEKLKETNTLNKKVEIMKEYHSILLEIESSIISQDKINIQLFKDIEDTVPYQLEFTIFNIDTSSIQIQGISEDRVSIAAFQHNLKKMDLFKIVHVNNIDKYRESNSFIFNMKCIFKDGNEHESD